MDDTIVEVRPRGDDDRGLLAVVAGALLGLDPPDVTVSYRCSHCGGTDHGQPSARARVGAAQPALAHLSLARAGELVAVAGRLGGPVGIDLEVLSRVASAGFDDVAFTPAELVAIEASPEPDAVRAEYWTAKEAVLKAAGTGLRTDPRLVEVGRGAVLVSCATSGIHPGDVRLRTWRPRPGYVATVAEIDQGPRLRA